MPEGTEGAQANADDAQHNQQDATQDAQLPPWEREGQQFDPERAWNLIQTLRGERDGLRSERDQLSGQVSEFQQQSMTEQERAVAAARDEGRQTAAREFGQELARTRFDALAGRRNADYDASSALEFVDLSRFVAADGSLDEQAIAAAVERLVPAAYAGPPSFDGGTRTSAPAGDFNQELRRAAGRA